MLLAVLLLTAAVALSGGVIVGVYLGIAWERGRRDAGGIAPHEALRTLYPDESTTTTSPASEFRPIPEARGDWWGV